MSQTSYNCHTVIARLGLLREIWSPWIAIETTNVEGPIPKNQRESFRLGVCCSTSGEGTFPLSLGVSDERCTVQCLHTEGGNAKGCFLPDSLSCSTWLQKSWTERLFASLKRGTSRPRRASVGDTSCALDLQGYASCVSSLQITQSTWVVAFVDTTR